MCQPSLPFLLLLLLGLASSQIASPHADVQLSADDTDLATEQLHRSLLFDPPLLDFGSTCPVGSARSHTVTLFNQNANRSVYLSSVSGRTPAFYSSFFETKVVPPQGNTTFNVVFLPRKHGLVSTDLLIHTSFGPLRLLVRGEGRECPYRLKPIVGVKAPVNATLTPEIHMYNPHKLPLQILEVYSSGGQFQLELPSGGQEGPQTLWEIPPLSAKPVIRIRFHARNPGNHTAYIRIKISEQPNESHASSENVLVIPLEFEILPQHGMYAESPLIDFGRLTTHAKKPLRFKLKLSNSHERRPNELVAFDLREIAGLSFEPNDSTVTLDPKLFDASTTLEELLLLRAASKQNASQTQEFSVLIRAEVFKGTLWYDRNVTTFVQLDSNQDDKQLRKLVIRNDFEIPLALLNVSVENNASSVLNMQLAQDYRLRYEATDVVVLPPGQSMELLHLLLVNASRSAEGFKTFLRVHTNVTLFEIPVVVCSGRLHVSTNAGKLLPETAYNVDLNLGAIPLAEMSHSGYIVLENRNPIAIKLTTWDFQSPPSVYFHTTFRGCLRSASLRALRNESINIESAKYKLCSFLEEGDVAIFQVSIQSYITEHHAGALKIWTAYEVITTSVKFHTWVGKLEVDQEQLYFKNCFPGKLCFSDLRIRSTFQHPIHITSINFTDAGLHFEDASPNGSTIAPETTTKIGRIYFEPAQLCQNRCYIPQDDDGKISSLAFPKPQDTKGGHNNNLHFDETELRRRTELFRHLKWYFQKISFILNSQEVRQFQLQLIIDIEWPKLVPGGKQTLSPIEVGKTQQMSVVITNPADSPILVDYFLADPSFAPQTRLSLPLEVVDISTNCYLTDHSVFTLTEGAPSQPILLPARASIPVHVKFESPVADSYCTLLHIRNNLTLYEALWISAKTVQSQFRFGNRKPGSNTPLLFEVSEKHLSACSQKGAGEGGVAGEYPRVITRRTFTARNTGEIPIWIQTFLIGDQPCEGYGFKVLDCTSFELKANDSKKIEIAFSPDFTSSRITRPLTVVTNLSYHVNYVLLAQLPPVSLDQCSRLLPRPTWEEDIRHAAIVLLATSFVLVLIAAHIDYGNILVTQTALHQSRDKGPVHPTFNLRNIAVRAQQQYREEEERNAAAATAALPVQSQRPVVSRGNGNSCQSSKSSGSGGGNLRKRSVKKQQANVGRKMSLSEMVTWPLDLSALKGASPKNFKAADSVTPPCSNSSSSVSSSESGKSAKAVPREKDATPTSSTGGGKKTTQTPQQSRAQKRAKNATTQAAGEKLEKEEERVLATPKVSPVVAGKGSKAAGKGDSEATPPSKPSAELLSSPHTPGPAPAPAVREQTSRKMGKTPGRERRKENSNNAEAGNVSANSSSSSKRLDSKQKNKSKQFLDYGTLPTGNAGDTSERAAYEADMHCISSPWETSNQVSFSDVLQSQKSAGGISANVNTPRLSTQANVAPAPQLERDLSHSHSQRVMPFGNYAAPPADNGVSSELGPIGSKKSPSSTPWEPVVNASSAPSAAVLKPSTSHNSSFFPNYLGNTYAYDEAQPFMGMSPNLYELKQAEEELQRQRQWQANEYLLNLRHQQLQAQAQVQAQQRLQRGNDAGNWGAINASTWSSLAYGHNIGNSAQIAPNVNGAANVMPGVNAALSPWQSSGVVRPPPGLEANFQSGAQHVLPTSEPVAPAVSAAAQPEPEMPTFDPFSSLSSIWSDNWNTNQHHGAK